MKPDLPFEPILWLIGIVFLAGAQYGSFVYMKKYLKDLATKQDLRIAVQELEIHFMTKFVWQERRKVDEGPGEGLPERRREHGT
jgi:hypothetical protein